MNSEGLNGILIRWNTPIESRDYNDLSASDFEVINNNSQCPVIDGSPITFIGVDGDYEWLLKSEGARVDDIDYRLYKENVSTHPTNIKDSVFINYNKYLTEYSVIRRNSEELIESIRQMENEANLSIQNESEKAKMQMIAPAVQAKLSNGLTLTVPEQSVYDRMLEVAEKALLNASNAATLIAKVNASESIDLDLGWTYDNVTPQGFPFNA